MSTRATGHFDVQLTPEAGDSSDSALGRLSIQKRFEGDLVGNSVGLMLAASSEASGSAGYVAMECVTGTLDGRSGGFILQHDGTMTRDSSQLSIRVTPGSGTGELTGLMGSMTIEIVDGRHTYSFDYELRE